MSAVQPMRARIPDSSFVDFVRLPATNYRVLSVSASPDSDGRISRERYTISVDGVSIADTDDELSFRGIPFLAAYKPGEGERPVLSLIATYTGGSGVQSYDLSLAVVPESGDDEGASLRGVAFAIQNGYGESDRGDITATIDSLGQGRTLVRVGHGPCYLLSTGGARITLRAVDLEDNQHGSARGVPRPHMRQRPVRREVPFSDASQSRLLLARRQQEALQREGCGGCRVWTGGREATQLYILDPSASDTPSDYRMPPIFWFAAGFRSVIYYSAPGKVYARHAQ